MSKDLLETVSPLCLQLLSSERSASFPQNINTVCRGGPSFLWHLNTTMERFKCVFCICFFQSHTYINLADQDGKSETVSRSGIASVKSDSSLSLSKPDSLSSQMAKLSKFFVWLPLFVVAVNNDINGKHSGHSLFVLFLLLHVAFCMIFPNQKHIMTTAAP